MLHYSGVFTQSHDIGIPDVVDLEDIFAVKLISELCSKYRSTGKVTHKQDIPVILASGHHMFIDIDGSNHIDGNQFDIQFEEIAKLVPHVAWFISPSGKGMKLLIELSRDYTPEEKDGIRMYLFETISEMTGLKVDPCRTDLAFATDFPLHQSDGIFPIPDVLEKRTTTRTHVPMINSVPLTGDTSRLAEILDMCEEVMSYNKWFSIIISALSLCGENAIPLLDSKWKTSVPYASLLKYASEYNYNILEAIWATRTRKCGYTYSDTHKRLTVSGATGSGKSAYAIEQIKDRIVDRFDVQSNYVIYVVSSVEQAIAFGKKLEQNGITFEILVSNKTYMAAKPDIKSQVATTSSHNKNVMVIQLAALKNHSYYKHVRDETRRLRHIYIDELTLTDFVCPTIMKSNTARVCLGIDTDDDMMLYYQKQYGAKDFRYAMRLAEEGDDSHFISSLLYQDADTTVLTTEELTVNCLELLGFKGIVIRKDETDSYRETCTLHLSESPDYVVDYVQSDEFKMFTKELNFKEVFANNCLSATGNLVSIKGQHRTGKNLSVIRCLPRTLVRFISELFTSCFRNSTIDPVALYYKDSLMQAVGRSIGFRGDTEAWVMVHSRVWPMIQHLDFIYKIENWDVVISPELKRKLEVSRISRKELAKTSDLKKSTYWKDEKVKKIRHRLTVTGDPKDILLPADVKSIVGNGCTLPDVAGVFNLEVARTKRHGRHLVGVKVG
jgi:hypothetical protein